MEEQSDKTDNDNVSDSEDIKFPKKTFGWRS